MQFDGLILRSLRFVEIILITLSLVSPTRAASTYKVLHAFGSGSDGAELENSVTLDKKGSIYGTTVFGGAYGYGTVFKVTHKPDGQWVEKLLHSFDNGDPDGQQPLGGVTLDGNGNLYGVASFGAQRGGTAFEMTPGPSGWSLTVIHGFCSQPDCSDGSGPKASMIFDSKGNLYGTASGVFKLTPEPDGWIERLLCNVDCHWPSGELVLDAKGNLYGTTYGGGAYELGTVFKLRHMPDGTWVERVLHSFGSGGDGRLPGHGNLALDSAGNFYGTTQAGGKYSCGNATCGTVFRLSRQPSGHWKETILHNFKLGKGGYWPGAGVVVDAAGNLYGTAGVGGTDCDCGVVYKMSPNPDDSWSYEVLHRFKGSDGAFPSANLVFDDQGNLYGTTRFGGSGGGGVVFEITP